MSTIYFNDTLRRNLNQALFTREYNVSAENYEYGFHSTASLGNPIVYGTVKLMKGAVPTDFTSLTSSTSRASDTLVTWVTSSVGWTFSNPVTNDTGLAEISCPYAVASASGIASWFWWYITQPPATTNILVQLVGTVGTSGTDLVIANTTIIAGANYRFQNLKFDIPATYTY